MVSPARWEWWLRCWLGITLVTVGMSWSLHVVSFNHVKEGALWLGCVGMMLAVAAGPSGALSGFRVWMPAWCSLAVLGLISVLRAEVPWLAVESILRAAGLLAVASMAYRMGQGESGRQMIGGTIVGTAVLTAIFALGQRAGLLGALFPSFPHYDQTMYSVFGNSGLLGGYLALGLVLLPGLSRSCAHFRGAALMSLFAGSVMALALLYSASRGAQLALAIGLCVYLARSRGRVGFPSGRSLAVVALAGTLLLVAGAPSLSKWAALFQPGDVGGAVRGWIWQASGSLFLERPFLGVGMGNFSYGLPPHLGRPVEAVPEGATVYHAHLDLLEMVCEVGVLGVVLVVLQLRAFRFANTMATAGLVTLAVFSCFHPMWASAPHGMAFLLLLGMNLKTTVNVYTTRFAEWPERSLRVGAAAVLIGCAMLYYVTTLQPSFLLRRAEDRHLAGVSAKASYEAAVAGLGFRGEAWESFGIYQLEQGDLEAAWGAFQMARRELNTGRLYLLMGKTAQQLGRREVARRCFQQSEARGGMIGAIESGGPAD